MGFARRCNFTRPHAPSRDTIGHPRVRSSFITSNSSCELFPCVSRASLRPVRLYSARYRLGSALSFDSTAGVAWRADYAFRARRQHAAHEHRSRNRESVAHEAGRRVGCVPPGAACVRPSRRNFGSASVIHMSRYARRLWNHARSHGATTLRDADILPAVRDTGRHFVLHPGLGGRRAERGIRGSAFLRPHPHPDRLRYRGLSRAGDCYPASLLADAGPRRSNLGEHCQSQQRAARN